jgi:biopolymer transport protein ExbB
VLSQRLLEFALIGAEWVLWLLVVLSVYSVAVMLDRLVLYFRTREPIHRIEPPFVTALTEGDLSAAREAVKGDGLVRNVLRAGLAVIEGEAKDLGHVEQAMLGALARERARYDARLIVLGTVGNNAPFIGLFGTVLGIIQAFHELGQLAAGQEASKVVMAGVSEALVATGVGIMVAIPAVAAYNASRAHVGARVRQAEALMRSMLSALPGDCNGGPEG